MIALRFCFPGGRYHATPWGHHVNEGLVEWPPSPWRIARALFAVGFAREGWVEGALPPEALEIADALSTTLPSYALPPASTAHTRHYMPIGAKTTKVFDTFAYVGDGALWAVWEADLGADARALLARVAEQLPYLGRAESWVECEAFDALPSGVEPNCRPAGTAEERGATALVLAPVPAAEYAAWRTKALDVACVGLTKAKRKKVESTYPIDALSALLSRTGDLQSSGWTRPPGSRDVLYGLPARALTAPPRTLPHSKQSTESHEFALYALTGDGLRGTVRPRVTLGLPIAELLHRALAKELDGVICPELTGRDEADDPLVGHRHAHILPLDVDGDARIDHVLVWAPMGLGADARAALGAVRVLRDPARETKVSLTLAGTGGRRDVDAALAALKSDVCGTSCRWVTCTPFVAPRHLKARGRDTIEGQIVAELHSRGLPTPRKVRVSGRAAVADSGFYAFVRARRGKRRAPPSEQAVHFEVEFDETLDGPIALGYAAHFGLGQLRPVKR